MDPTLRDGQHLMLWRYHAKMARTGDVVAFTVDGMMDGTTVMVKRVAEPPTHAAGDPTEWFYFEGDAQVSISSRDFGPVQRARILARRHLVRGRTTEPDRAPSTPQRFTDERQA